MMRWIPQHLTLPPVVSSIVSSAAMVAIGWAAVFLFVQGLIVAFVMPLKEDEHKNV
jgi:hypothetical protein